MALKETFSPFFAELGLALSRTLGGGLLSSGFSRGGGPTTSRRPWPCPSVCSGPLSPAQSHKGPGSADSYPPRTSYPFPADPRDLSSVPAPLRRGLTRFRKPPSRPAPPATARAEFSPPVSPAVGAQPPPVRPWPCPSVCSGPLSPAQSRKGPGVSRRHHHLDLLRLLTRSLRTSAGYPFQPFPHRQQRRADSRFSPRTQPPSRPGPVPAYRSG